MVHGAQWCSGLIPGPGSFWVEFVCSPFIKAMYTTVGQLMTPQCQGWYCISICGTVCTLLSACWLQNCTDEQYSQWVDGCLTGEQDVLVNHNSACGSKVNNLEKIYF